jgi:hypothetical protein
MENIMQIKLPQIGQTYISGVNPKLVVYVVDVIVIETDEGDDTDFIVEGCDPAYKDDTRNADGYDITADVWFKNNFTLAAE